MHNLKLLKNKKFSPFEKRSYKRITIVLFDRFLASLAMPTAPFFAAIPTYRQQTTMRCWNEEDYNRDD